MFASGIHAIYKKIGEIKEGSKRKEAFLSLESKIMSSPILKHQFAVMNFIKKNRNTAINQESFKKFVKELKEKNVIFIKENKASHLKVWKENKALFEYFNINPKELTVTLLDSALDIYSTGKNLNEAAVKKLIFKSDKDIGKEKFKEKSELIKESFSQLIKKENKRHLKTQFQIVNYLSECMTEKTKHMTQTALQAIFEEKDYQSQIKKLFKLRIIAEKIIREDTTDYSDWKKKSFDIDDKPNVKSGGSHVSLQDAKYIKKISVETMNAKNPDKVLISFSIPFYPMGKIRTATWTSTFKMKEKVGTLKTAFVNGTIYNTPRQMLFDPVGTLWDATQKRKQANIGQPNAINVTVYLNTRAGHQNTWDDYVQGAYEAVKAFDKILPGALGDMADNLNPKNQLTDVEPDIDLNKKHLAAKDKNGDVKDNVRVDTWDDYFGKKIPTRKTVHGGSGGVF